MATNHCPTCYRDYLAAMQRRIGKDRNVFIDVQRMTFRCRIPTFTHDHNGLPIVIVRDCAKKKEIVLSQAEWLKKRTEGEL